MQSELGTSTSAGSEDTSALVAPPPPLAAARGEPAATWAPRPGGAVLRPDEYEILDRIQRRVLWLATLMIHHANHVRPNPDDIKVGGHQASSASMVSILTALYFRHLQAGDRVSVKPHASPAYHAIQYLLGNLDTRYLTTLRAFGGLQAYPSRTKDPDPVDFSTGSVGLGAVAPAFAAVAARYARLHFGDVTARRFIAIVGDAELDEGNVWDAVAEEALAGLGNVMLVVDLNRQSLDRVVPGVRAAQLKGLFAAAGWRVLEAKYGRQLQEAFHRPGGERLRLRIDEMSNEEYQSLLRRRRADLRARLTHSGGLDASEGEDPAIVAALIDTPDETLHELLANLGGHDLNELLGVFARADESKDAPAVVFAYTIKGWGLPFAADALNHSMLLTGKQVTALGRDLGIVPGAEWEAFTPDSPEGRWCAATTQGLQDGQGRPAPLVPAAAIPDALDLSYPKGLSTQEALGRILPRLAEVPALGERIVTTAPDVAISTHLSNWVTKVGVFAPADQQRLPGRYAAYAALAARAAWTARRTGYLRAVIVADQEARSRVEWRRLAQLLGDPGIGRMPRDADVDNAARAKVDDEKGKERAEAQVDDRQEVAGPHVVGVIMQERCPRLSTRARRASRAHVTLDCALADPDAELEEFAADALRSPQPVLDGYPLDQRDGLLGHLWHLRGGCRSRAPHEAIPLAMPA